ncbi:cytochrome b/b6 domain-containing protein [Nitrogeniibacter aestuarii]|uniref:cytochrome b/b6 domain-containing protein n=1 Tax=Nitrogeniibacter aestuarii TaxID=2815343 RepID=UPI001E3012B5|nr:cytochrome b/b6 domain-containing protein [Nitrogeniibacter aestuarii]
MSRTIRLWDLPTRLFHWLLVLAVIGAFVTVKIGGNLMVWHGRLGLLMIGLLVFRLVWGVIGSTYARFSQFVRGPAAIKAYLAGTWQGVGHNPLGALSVLALLALMIAQAATGLFSNDDIAFNGPLYPLVSKDTSDAITGWHHWGENGIFLLVGLHLAAIVFYAIKKQERLVPPMVTGKKAVESPKIKDATGGGPIAFGVAVVIAALATWAASGAFNPPPPAPPEPANYETPAW